MSRLGVRIGLAAGMAGAPGAAAPAVAPPAPAVAPPARSAVAASAGRTESAAGGTEARPPLDAGRAAMLEAVAAGAGAGAPTGARAGAVPSTAGRGRVVVARGCDPAMADRAATMLPPLLDGAVVVTATDDDRFLRLLSEGGDGRYAAVLLAPGACRWSARNAPIPGANEATRGWGIDRYRAEVAARLGADVPVVATAEERELVPLLRAALGLGAGPAGAEGG